MPKWLDNAVFYEIYPQSFRDTNADGIGDIPGITEKLDYIKDLGCNALWLNPCFDSPFKDAGYDVRDYKKVAPRYGTNEDLYTLFEQAHKRGIHVFLDLVAGHSSEEHEWFRQSQKQEKNEYSGRYIWTNFCFQGMQSESYNFIAGESERSGSYIVNFYKCQPALNYGFLRPEEEWQSSMNSPESRATVESIKDIMRFWMDRGCDGFRVDMASSLVKNDDAQKSGTSAIWTEIREMFDHDYPECALVAEWGDPKISLPAGFHMDFLLNEPGNGYSTLLRDYANHNGGYTRVMSGPGFNGLGKIPDHMEDHSFFRKDAGGSIQKFISSYLEQYEIARKCGGYICMISCNHDTVRPAYTLTSDELKLFYTFLLTMPGVPFLYYGDEIGMNYLNLPTKEGGYFRTGSRSPMQWSRSRNLGFSDADTEKLYLPVDPSVNAPTAEEEAKDPSSLFCTIRTLLALRAGYTDLQSSAGLDILYAKDSVIVYRRGSILTAVNTAGHEVSVPLPPDTIHENAEPMFQIGSFRSESSGLVLGAQSAVVLQ